MPQIDLGKVTGDKGTSVRNRGNWVANTAYVNDAFFIDYVSNAGNMYACKTSHTSGSSFSDTNWELVVKKGEKGDPGNKGDTPIIQAGTATSLDATAAPTVSATTSGNTTTFNFGIPKGDTSDIRTPTFTDTVSTYSTLSAANDAAETASDAIKSKVSIFTILSNMKKSFSAIVQGLKILGTNVGAITGITSDLAGESETVAASIKAVNQLNSKLGTIGTIYSSHTLVNDSIQSGLNNYVAAISNLPKGKYVVMGKMLSYTSNNAGTLTASFVVSGKSEDSGTAICTAQNYKRIEASNIIEITASSAYVAFDVYNYTGENITIDSGWIKAIRIG